MRPLRLLVLHLLSLRLQTYQALLSASKYMIFTILYSSGNQINRTISIRQVPIVEMIEMGRKSFTVLFRIIHMALFRMFHRIPNHLKRPNRPLIFRISSLPHNSHPSCMIWLQAFGGLLLILLPITFSTWTNLLHSYPRVRVRAKTQTRLEIKANMIKVPALVMNLSNFADSAFCNHQIQR